ncbi:DUF2247 family protein [Gottfriedia solisilvae]|uniref:DUF2247 family protein n=1 Tax=Gottfriedia solisilvae TaxID=1516104 RepID=UPI003D2EF373
MNSFNITFNFKYASNLVDLTWRDILFGINNGFFSPEVAIENAISEITSKEEKSDLVFQIAQLFKGESIHPFIDELVSNESRNEADSTAKFLYILLNWLYENRNKYDNWMEMIWNIYLDFHSPEEIYELIPYVSPEKYDRVAPLDIYILTKWKEYLDEKSLYYKS